LSRSSSPTSRGAQIFAPDNIGRAIDLYDQARAERLRREWLLTRTLALESRVEATTALSISEEFRGRPAEALLSDRQGFVEGQRPEDITWRGLELQAILIEQERVRTLSDSTAQITFRDASRLRLNANATAVIQVMRADPLSRQEAAKVSLIEGDFYVLQSGDSARRTFDVEIPEVSATVQSGDFWVQADAEGARFTNYDREVVQITTANDTVTIGQNEGAVVAVGAAPETMDLLAPAELISPENGAVIFSSTAQLAWAARPGAAGFWLEVAADPQFDRMVASRFGLEQPEFETDPLDPGTYYWRVADLDQFGLPGQRSEIRSFERAIDTTPPYLTIDGPASGAIVREAAFTVTGRSEPGIALTVNGADVAVGADGSYSAPITLTEGDNLLVALATDLAGNLTRKERSVALMSDRQSLVRFDPAIPTREPGHFLTIEEVLSLSGETTPLSAIEVRAADGTVRSSAVTDAAGAFRLNVPLLAAEEQLTVAVIAPSGFTTTEPIAASIDSEAPVVTLAQPLPRLTAATEIVFAGETEADAFLTFNGELVELDGGRFSLVVPLKAGANPLELISADAVGNIRVDRWTVTLDQDAPRLVASNLSREPEGDRVRLYVDVSASDASGLAAAAPFVLATPSGQLTGYLRFNRATQTYSGSVSVASADAAAAQLASIELRDDAGNSQTFTFN
jgi:hypothetical protein